MSPRTKAVIAVHYFGFPQDFSTLRAWCDERAVKLIEDCAHCFFGKVGTRSVGTFGHYAFASPMKFFPLYDGGCLIAPESSPSTSHGTRPGFLFELKAAANVLERSYRYNLLPGRLLWRMLFLLQSLVWKRVKLVHGHSPTLSPSEGGNDFQPQWSNVRMSFVSSVLMSAVSHARVVDRRQENYRALLERLRNLEGAKPLYDTLPNEVVPYVFPLYLECPDVIYPRLKRNGVPVLRWDDADKDSCPVSRLYARHLVFVACHQELSSDAILWIARQVASAVTTAQ
jgi:hypothetical protein